MKKIVSKLIAVILLTSLSINYTEANLESLNDKQSIESSKLLQKHVSKLKKQLNNFKSKYYVKNDQKIDYTLENINKMIDLLSKAESGSLEKTMVHNINKAILEELKKINQDIKPYLKSKVEEKNKQSDKYKNKYSDRLKKYSGKLRNIINTVASKIKSKNSLSQKDEDTMKSLRKIEANINNLENFSRLKGKTKEELKIYIMDNIKDIKKEIVIVKNNLSK